MAIATPVVKPISHMHLAPGSVATIPNITWAEFEAILLELGPHRAARVAYSNGILEIVVPFPEHEKPKEIISDMVKYWLKSARRSYESFGSTTFKQENRAGVEPDACFYIEHAQQMIGKRRIERDDPPPDLAIEADVTSKTTLEAYQSLGFPEVWIYDRGALTIYVLQEGQYLRSDSSPTFPSIAVSTIVPLTVERSWQIGSSQALSEFEDTI
jgi:Uma2 family endonuclease